MGSSRLFVVGSDVATVLMLSCEISCQEMTRLMIRLKMSTERIVIGDPFTEKDDAHWFKTSVSS